MALRDSAPTYAAYWLYKLDPTFARLPADTQQTAREEYLAALESRPSSVTLRGVYSLVGFREDADIMYWVHGVDTDAMQDFAVRLRQTTLGRYLSAVQMYVGVVAGGRYDPAHLPSFMLGAEPKNYISVYPFVKTTDWYLLPYDRRRELMAEHGIVGRRFAVAREYQTPSVPSAGRGGSAATATAPAATETATETGGGVLSNTVDAFGLGDYEFILANESDDPSELCRMMEALRATEVRRYTKLDVPIFLGRRRTPEEALSML
ncbi:MAG TPA: chlorite dismutase family protein [Ktedonobacterales bacterium]